MLYRSGYLIGLQYQLDSQTSSNKISLNKQNSQGCLEPAGDLPGFEVVIQDILDHDTIQKVLDRDNSFSEDSDCCVDSDEEMDGEISSEEGYNGPIVVPCEQLQCAHFSLHRLCQCSHPPGSARADTW